MPTNPRYVRAESYDEALSVLTEHGPDASVLSGGQSLVPMMSAGLAAPDVLVDVNWVPQAELVELGADHVTIGGCVRHRDLELASAELDRAVPTLRPAGRLIAHAAVRTRGTMVGSICHADPAAEWPAVALATDARMVLAGTGGSREVAAKDFFLGPMTTAREPEEIVTQVKIPTAPAGTFAAVTELAYRDGDYAVVGVIAQVTVAEGGDVTDCRVVLFGVDATPVRSYDTERLVVEQGVTGLDAAAAAACDVVDPSSDATASREYRLSMVPVHVRRALEQALGRAGVLETT